MVSLRSAVAAGCTLALGLVVACASAPTTTQPAPSRIAPAAATAPPDAGVASVEPARTVTPPPPVDAGVALRPPPAPAAPVVEPCPASLVEAVTRPAATCRTLGKTCTYEAPGGSCACALTQAAQCGGQEMPHMDSLAWRCALAQPEKTTRADGCPLLPPKNGAACASDKACSWSAQGACARDAVSATCARGRWRVETLHGIVPP